MKECSHFRRSHFVFCISIIISFINEAAAEKNCDSFKLKGPGINMTCFSDPKAAPIPCNRLLSPSSAVQVGCRDMYHLEGDKRKTVNDTIQIVCQNGTWSRKRPNCYPICGKPVQPSSSRNDEKLTLGHSPWHVALYKIKAYPGESFISADYPDLICGGSIIEENLIISAAHCVRDRFRKYYDSSYFEVVVAKLTRDFNTQDHVLTKHYKIKRIFVPENFTRLNIGTGNPLIGRFGEDIALLETEEEISFNKFVHPICIDWLNTGTESFVDSQFKEYRLVGFGGQKNQSYGQILHETILKFINTKKCYEELSPEARSNIYDDKFCTKSADVTNIARPGDSGGGLVYRNRYYNSYYLSGIASSKDEVNSTLAIFTDLSKYIDWIDLVKDEISRNKKPRDSDE